MGEHTRRVARGLFTLCSAASFALGLAVCVLWARSYWRTTELYRESGGGEVFRNDWYRLEGGRFHWIRREGRMRGLDGEPYRDDEWIDVPLRDRAATGWGYGFARAPGAVEALGLWYARVVDTPEPDPLWRRGVWVPCSLAAAALGLPPLLWLHVRQRGRRPRRRLAAGPCSRCGYDLRASAGRCPECGTPGGPEVLP